ncbi:MAG: hypothetical protein ACXWP0_17635 [Ktedonobacterales bacterium]
MSMAFAPSALLRQPFASAIVIAPAQASSLRPLGNTPNMGAPMLIANAPINTPPA